MWGCGMDSFGSGYGSVEGHCEHNTRVTSQGYEELPHSLYTGKNKRENIFTWDKPLWWRYTKFEDNDRQTQLYSFSIFMVHNAKFFGSYTKNPPSGWLNTKILLRKLHHVTLHHIHTFASSTSQISYEYDKPRTMKSNELYYFHREVTKAVS
jgi:hypothetical protein